MRRPSRTGLLWAMVFSITTPVTAQNLESIGKENPLSLSGGISFNHVYYTSRGIAARRDPHNFIATGNANIGLYGWIIPLHFTLSNERSTFAQPFNQYVMHPRWKWITLHAGHTSMSFSPYTVNGHIFRGIGIELDPGNKWHLSALYGRFMRAVEADSTAGNMPAFRRRGYAIKARYGDGNDFFELIAFHARDDESSIATPHDTLQLKPRQNLVASAAGSKTLVGHFVLKAEIAASTLTRDTRAASSKHKPLAKMFAFPTTTSTAHYRAIRASLDYQREGWAIGTGYERIDPGYETLGAYYFNNDLENVTVNAKANILKGKMNVAISSGIQHDNVDNTKVRTMRRMVGSCNIAYVHSEKMNVSASWSTFQNFTNIRPHFEILNALTPYDNVDTLNFKQISKNASLFAMYSPGTDPEKRHNLNLNFSWQTSADLQGATPPVSSASVAFYNMNAGYTVSFLPHNTGLSIMLNASLTRGGSMDTHTIGPTASLTRSYLDRKLRTTASVSWNSTANNKMNIGSVTNGRVNLAASIRHDHHLSLGAVFVSRQSKPSQMNALEFTVTAGYQYSFPKQKPK